MLSLLRRAFELLVPKGWTTITARPGVSLHHTEAAKNFPGVVEALVAEYRDAEGGIKRYVYAQLDKGAQPTEVQAAIAADPLFAGEETLLFPVDSIAALEEEGHGLLLERRGTWAGSRRVRTAMRSVPTTSVAPTNELERHQATGARRRADGRVRVLVRRN